MTTSSRIGRIALLALALGAAGMAKAAYAEDAFGAYMANQPIKAARTPLAPPTATVTRQFAPSDANDFGAASAKPRSPTWQNAATAGAPRVVSTKPMAAAPDLVGAPGSRQDDLAREIYLPGSRPAGW